MKKLLFGILTFLGIGLSFCSAGFVCSNSEQSTEDLEMSVGDTYTYTLSGYYVIQQQFYTTLLISDGNNIYTSTSTDFGYNILLYFPVSTSVSLTCTSSQGDTCWNYITYLNSNITDCNNGGNSNSSTSDISVYYNNGNSVESITCDGVQAINIQGLSSITYSNTFTPYFNISYTDEDNQKLTESYSKDILYLENGQFKKTYTGNNDWILSVQGSSENTFTGYVPVFDFTGDTIVNSGNVFNNFSDNALKVLLSNIPSYIQYITIFMILVFLFSFIRRFKRKS